MENPDRIVTEFDADLARTALRDLDQFRRLSLDMFCIADMEGCFKWANPTCERVLAYSPTELMSRPYLELVHPDDIEATKREMAGPKAGHPAVQFTNRYRHKERGYRCLEWNAVPATHGDVIYAVARDVTRQRHRLGATALRWFIYLAPKPHRLRATSENTRRQTCG